MRYALNMATKFFMSVTGHRYSHYLINALTTLARANPDHEAIVWHDSSLSSLDQSLAMSVHPNLSLKEIDIQPTDYAGAVSVQKWSLWWSFLKTLSDGQEVVFLDVDLLHLRPIDDIFGGFADVVFTLDQSKWPLNTGVVGVRKSEEAHALIGGLIARMRSIAASTSDTKAALSAAGSIDQAAVLEALEAGGYSRSRVLDEAGLLVSGLKIRTVPREIYNETSSVQGRGTDRRILHVKRKMQDVIDSRGQFSEVRSRESSEWLYSLWEQTYADATKAALTNHFHKIRASITPEQEQVLAGTPFESRGILPSELAAVVGFCNVHNVETIFESGRARGFSTEVLAACLPQTRIISVENSQDPDSEVGRRKLTGIKNVSLFQGNAEKLLPRLLKNHIAGSAIVLIDGPKGRSALKLVRRLVRSEAPVLAYFLHDTHHMSRGRPNSTRHDLSSSFNCVWFSDEKEWVSSTAFLDKNAGHEPGFKGNWRLGSYGPTIAMVVPTYRDIATTGEVSRLLSGVGKLKRLVTKKARDVLFFASNFSKRS